MMGGAKTIRPTCGSTATRAVRWCLTFGWAATGMGPSASWATLPAGCKATVTGPMIRWAARAWCTWRALAHARRKFFEAVRLNAQDEAAIRIVAQMDALFAVDAQARAGGLTQEARHELRLQKAPPLLEQLKAGIEAARAGALPQSALAKACNYTLTLGGRLTRFLDHPEVELSNNVAENSMRPVALGRRNWIHIGSKEAGPRVANLLSVVETCRRLVLPVRKYLAAVLPGLADFPVQRAAELTPQAWAARK